MALSVYEVVKGIYQAIHNKHHGATDENGKPVQIGLKREDQPIRDQKVIDGFGISLHGNTLLLRYSSYEPLSNLHDKKFEREMERRLEEIKKFLQKEFQKNTGTSLRLKEAGEIKVLVETSNRVKAMVKALMAYEVLNLKDKVEPVGGKSASETLEQIDTQNKAMMKKALKPRNVTVKEK